MNNDYGIRCTPTDTLDPIERLLVNLRRAGFLDGRECFALHAAYLRESETAPQVR